MKKRSRVKTISRIRGSKTPERIVMKFCMMVVLPDVVTRAKLDGDRFGHFRVVGGRISGFPIDFASRPYNTLALPCQSVMTVMIITNWYNNVVFFYLDEESPTLSVIKRLQSELSNFIEPDLSVGSAGEPGGADSP